ncbi:hypothetical protein Tco_0255437 [Tanacetum coccineum]
MLQSISNDSVGTTVVINQDISGLILPIHLNPWEKILYWIFEQLAIRLASTERDLERALLKPRHLRDDRYGCLFQQLGSVETQGESSGAGHETCVIVRNVNGDEKANSQGFLLTPAYTTCFRTAGSTHVGLPASRSSKRVHCNVFQTTLSSEASPSKIRRPSTARVTNTRMLEFNNVNGVSYVYDDVGDCDQRCHHCGVAFWLGERLKGHSNSRRPEYHLCGGRGKFYMEPTPDPPEYIKHLLLNKHFMENIWAYNQMFAMTSSGAKTDESINNGRGPYVFKVSGQIRLYNGDGARGYELPTSNTLGAIVFYSGITNSTEFDVFPLLFIYEQSGFKTELKLRRADDSGRDRRVTMLAYYAFQLHWVKSVISMPSLAHLAKESHVDMARSTREAGFCTKRDPTAQNHDPMIGNLYGQDQKERVMQGRPRIFINWL